MKALYTAFFVLVTLFALVPASTAQEVPPQASGLNPGSRASDAAPDSITDDRYIVYFRQYGPQASASVRAAGGAIVYEFPQYSAIAVRLPDQALRALQNDPNVQRIEVDPRRYPLALNDTSLGTGETRPYGIEMVQANQLADANAGTRKVCIIDSGYHAAHVDLQDGSITTSPDSGTGDPLVDKSGHGTHVAGTIAALGGNGAGVVGTLPGGNIKLHIVKVFGDDGKWAYSSTLAAAVGKCRDNLSNLISMSLGGGFPSTLEQNAFDAAYNNGVLSIAAAGNGGNTSTLYPAGYASVISVAAVDNTETLASFSQRNADVELAAPGVQVLSTVPWNEANTLTVDGVVYQGNWIEFAARSSGVSGTLVNGGLCDATGSWSGKVVLCERGSITFFSKVNNVTAGGGVAAVIYNNATGNFSGTLGAGNTSSIPAISLTQADGQFLVASKLDFAGTVVSVSENPGSGYEKWDGTSMATPHVSGVAALVWSYNPVWTNDQIRQALQATAKDLGAAGRDNSYGYGLVQAKAALCYLQPTAGVCGGTDTTRPTVSSINRVGANPTNAASVSFAVTFTESVTGVDATDFALAITGVSGAAITPVSGSGSSYTVAVNTGSGDGTIGLNLVDNDSIKDLANNPLGGSGPGNGNFTGQVFTVDKTAPTVTLVTPTKGADGVAVSTNVTATFSEAMDAASLTTATFTLVKVGGAAAGVVSYAGVSKTATLDPTANLDPNTIYTATVTAGAKDLAGNPLVQKQWSFTTAALPPSTSVHVGDLDGTRVNQGSTWMATVTITVHDDNHNPVSGANVNGAWTGTSGASSCTSGGDGRCSLASGNIPKKQSSVTFTVSNILTGLTYDSTVNHDADGDSNGTSIAVNK